MAEPPIDRPAFAGDYEFHDSIGKAGSATVYLARKPNAPDHAANGSLMTIDQLVILGTNERVRAEIERLRERLARLMSRSAPS